jgi:hypothetical protein
MEVMMKYKNPLLLTLALAIFCICAGCPKRIVVTLYNNTDLDCRMVLYGKSQNLNSKATARFDYPLLGAELGIQCHGTNLSYRMPQPPKSSLKTRPFAEAVSFQLESDGAIYALVPSNRFPAKILADQPEGFPLRPTGRVASP